MKRVLRFCLPLLLLLAFANGFAQEKTLEQLLALPDDTAKVSKLSAYYDGIKRKEPEKARALARSILDLGKKLRYEKGIASGYAHLGYLDVIAGENRSAIGYYTEAIPHYKKAGDNSGLAVCYGSMANAFSGLGKNDSSMIHRMGAISLLEKMKATPSFSRKDIRMLSLQYYNLAVDYANSLKDDDKALSYYKKSEEMARQCNDTVMIVTALNGVTRRLANKQQFKDALSEAKEALRLAQSSGDVFLLTQAYNGYATALDVSGRLDEAGEAARLAIRYAEESGDFSQYMMSATTYSSILRQKGDYGTLKTFLEKVLQKTGKKDNIEFSAEIYGFLAEANYKLGNYQPAYDQLYQKLVFNDSILNVENHRIMADMEFRYQTAQKEKALSQNQLQLAQKDLQLQKNRQYMYYTGAGLVVALLIAALFFARYRHRQRMHQKEIQSLQQQKEIQLLQALMQGEEKERSRIAKDLHDGVAGMLAAVKMHLSADPEAASTTGYTRAVDLLNEATTEVRKTAHNLMPEVLLKYGLDTALRRYCSNISSASLQVHYYFIGEEQRYRDSFELSVYRIVQELLNNIFKHSRATEASVQLSIQGTVLSLSIEDNGIGFSKQPAQTGGMGLDSLKHRIHALNGNIEVNAETGGGVNAYLEFDTMGLRMSKAKAEPLVQ
ncbi:MAG TPA: sensor histidine kinase [Chitinophagaceae bacterium]|jgi:signal transduction histidine kinase|nr:sensor histidine kinase [Chitinophagaceae bacterium]